MMSRTDRPLIPKDEIEVGVEKDYPLPDKIQLLSPNEIMELITQYRDQLALYVTQFNPQADIRNKVIESKRRLLILQEKCKLLEGERDKTQEELEECRILESQYVKQYQDLKHKIDDEYSDAKLKEKFESQIKQLDEQSARLELEAKYDANIEQFTRSYMQIRTEYHMQREKLATWYAQGELKFS